MLPRTQNGDRRYTKMVRVGGKMVEVYVHDARKKRKKHTFVRMPVYRVGKGDLEVGERGSVYFSTDGKMLRVRTNPHYNREIVKYGTREYVRVSGEELEEVIARGGSRSVGGGEVITRLFGVANKVRETRTPPQRKVRVKTLEEAQEEIREVMTHVEEVKAIQTVEEFMAKFPSLVDQK